EILKDGASVKNESFQAILSEVRQRIIDALSLKALDLFNREFDFFEKLEKIKMQGEDLYLPTAPSMLVKGNPDRQWNTPSVSCQSPYITFDVVDRDGNQNDLKPQACIFKVGDDCRKDILALQVISLLRDIY
uniref:Uncharacterized protein n=1 Tax=Brassica oleracea var. oleracea TaxID=109376 RepID=A0A0D2ZR30_BRAOL